ncbi:MAG: FkbM family methyltransferase [Candidatus Binatia bacterium]
MGLNPLRSWTATFMRTWLPHMTWTSALRYRDLQMRFDRGDTDARQHILLTLKSPIVGSVTLREVPSDSMTFEEIIQEQVYRAVPRYVPQCQTVIDLGAHIGLASRYFASCYPSCHIVAVEPNPVSYDVLCLNLQPLVEQGRCQTLNVAVWERETILTAGELPMSDHYNRFSVREPRINEEMLQLSLPGLPMTQILDLSGFATVDILKIDIEGAEVQLFRQSPSWLSRVHALLIEFHGNSRTESRFDALMSRYGFRIYDENRHTLLAVREE